MKLEISRDSVAVDLSIEPPKVYNGKQLNRLVNNLAGHLTDCGLASGVNIGILGLNSVPYMVAVLGIFKTDRVCVPLNYKLPKDQIWSCIRDTNIGFVFCDSKFKHLVPDGITVVEFEKDFEQFVDDDYGALPKLDADRICLTLFTSGTTGDPKKINFSLKDRFRRAGQPSKDLSQASGFDHTHRSLSANPFFHNAGIYWLQSICSGTCALFVLPKFDADIFLKTIERYKIQSLRMVTPMMSMLLKELNVNTSVHLISVTNIALVSSFANIALINQVKKAFPNVSSITNPYGLTEIGVPIFGAHPNRIETPLGSTGYPLSDIRMKLVDSVLYVKSSDFHSSFDTNGQDYFNTRDMFKVDQHGFYYYIGRDDDMLKCGGEKVYPIEIESVLNQHPCVLHSVAVGLPDELKGHKPYAFVQLSSPCQESDILEFAIKHLASYQIPKHIWIMDVLPINEIGKIDKKYLIQLATQYIQS